MNIAIVKTKMEKHIFKCLNLTLGFFYVRYERQQNQIRFMFI